MPIAYSSEQLKAACESPSGMTPDRRNLLYHITCPLSQEPCKQDECEYGQCLESVDPEQESEIFITVYPQPGFPHPAHPLENFQDHMVALNGGHAHARPVHGTRRDEPRTTSKLLPPTARLHPNYRRWRHGYSFAILTSWKHGSARPADWNTYQQAATASVANASCATPQAGNKKENNQAKRLNTRDQLTNGTTPKNGKSNQHHAQICQTSKCAQQHLQQNPCPGYQPTRWNITTTTPPRVEAKHFEVFLVEVVQQAQAAPEHQGR